MTMARNGAGFRLPDEILSVIPADPYDQLDLAKRITSLAITSRVRRLETEASLLQEEIADRDQEIDELRDKLAHRGRLIQESDARLRAKLVENAKLLKERDTMAVASKKLAKDLSQFETFKNHLMRSLSCSNLSQLSGDDGIYRQPIARVSSWNDENSVSESELGGANGSTETWDSTRDGGEPRLSITRGLTPTATPKFSSTDGSSEGLPIAGSSAITLSGTTPPINSQVEEKASASPLCDSIQKSSAPNLSNHRQPLPGMDANYAERSGHLDGKELFREARLRLPYERFAAFLGAVKEFNAHTQSREETLCKTREIFGKENKDLYLSFHGLLNRYGA